MGLSDACGLRYTLFMTDVIDLACSEVWGGNRATEAALVLPGLQAWVVAKPFQGEDAGGDVHYVSSCGTGRITRVLLADVSGHGEAVAGLAEDLRKLMQRYLNHVDPNKLAARLNQELRSSFGNTGRFATAVVVTFWSSTGGMSVCNAGHPPPLIYRAEKGVWDTVDQPDTQARIANLPLGVLEESGYVGRELKLGLNDMLLSYTDCLIEAQRADHQQLGEAGLLAVLNALPPEVTQREPGQLIQAVLAEIQLRGYTSNDDLTAVVLRCTERVSSRGVSALLKGGVRFAGQMVRGEAPWPTFFGDPEPGRGL